jgi:2-iminobutanoate/2-iminopropanoate deaminase
MAGIGRSYLDHHMPPDQIEFLAPSGAIKPTGPWSVGVRAGDFVFVAGMRGIDPATNKLVEGGEARVRQAFRNMQTVAAAAGGTLRDAVRLVVYVTDMDRYRPLVNQIQEELWAGAPCPPRTIVEVSGLNQDDVVEVEGTFFCPLPKSG